MGSLDRTDQQVVAIDPTFSLAYLNLGHSYQALGRLDQAIALFEQYPSSVGNRGDAYAEAGRLEDARNLIPPLEEKFGETGSNAVEIAQVYCGLREIDRTFEWLARSTPLGTPYPPTFLVARVRDPLRRDTRFDELLKRHRLDPASLTGF